MIAYQTWHTSANHAIYCFNSNVHAYELYTSVIPCVCVCVCVCACVRVCRLRV